MADSGWSWSPSEALATFHSNMAWTQPHPTMSLSAPSGLPVTSESKPTLPPQGPDKENVAPAATPGPAGNSTTSKTKAAAPKTSATAKKRKSDVIDTEENLFPDNVPEISDDDPRLMPTRSDTCNLVRRKIKAWTESGAMKVGEFQNAIDVSSRGYSSFMNRTGTWDGEGCDAYINAHIFFKKRELQGLPLKASKAKKPKTAGSGSGSGKKPEELFDVSGVELPGEGNDKVPVYDTCDEVRKKTRAFLAKDGITQAAFVREISKTFKDGRSVSPANLRYFMGRKGVIEGNSNVTFYAAYVFFEKQRIKANKPKTKFREEMEKAHGPTGFIVDHNLGGPITLFADENAYFDKYGKLQITKRRR